MAMEALLFIARSLLNPVSETNDTTVLPTPTFVKYTCTLSHLLRLKCKE